MRLLFSLKSFIIEVWSDNFVFNLILKRFFFLELIMLHVISTIIVAVKQETFTMNWNFLFLFFLGLEFGTILSQFLVFFLHFYFFC